VTSPSAPVDVSPTAPPGVRAPDRALLWLEQRAFFELGALAAAAPWLRLLGRGDHHPVLVLPGFTASDLSTTPLRWHLRSWGYWAHGWHLGRNLGPTPGVLNGLVERLDTVHRRHGRKVSLVGWSLGGIYARELARQFPDHVRSVITLGSPYRMSLGDRSSVSRLLDVVGGTFAPEIIELWVQESERTPLAMPATSIYTRTDGIVRWHTCIDTEGH
jgi:pimeloyl-ACP methyl ester carboxylesterase